jgi:hypothetical protein
MTTTAGPLTLYLDIWDQIIVEERDYADMLGLLQQLGVIPARGA